MDERDKFIENRNGTNNPAFDWILYQIKLKKERLKNASR